LAVYLPSVATVIPTSNFLTCKQMALLKQTLEVMKTKIISHYGKSFRTSSKIMSYMKHEEDSFKETHFGFETVKESEKAEKGMTG
jgi:hypothetical protein